jgi:Phage regulatory protein Rha (Phage_pRha)
MSTLVTISQNVPLADSRQVASTLGIDHRSFFRMVTEYQEEIEQDFGKVRFEITPSGKTNQPQKYALLTEEQTYAYMSYSKNTEQARACKRLLVKAFMEARAQLQERQALAINGLWQRRLSLFGRYNQIPASYWCIFGFVAGHCHMREFRDERLMENALPDGSIGRMWCQYLRANGYDMSLVKQYRHRYPDKRGEQWANIYPNAWLGDFWTWFHSFYLEQHWPKYLSSHRLLLSAPSEAPRIKGDTA